MNVIKKLKLLLFFILITFTSHAIVDVHVVYGAVTTVNDTKPNEDSIDFFSNPKAWVYDQIKSAPVLIKREIQKQLEGAALDVVKSLVADFIPISAIKTLLGIGNNEPAYSLEDAVEEIKAAITDSTKEIKAELSYLFIENNMSEYESFIAHLYDYKWEHELYGDGVIPILLMDNCADRALILSDEATNVRIKLGKDWVNSDLSLERSPYDLFHLYINAAASEISLGIDYEELFGMLIELSSVDGDINLGMSNFHNNYKSSWSQYVTRNVTNTVDSVLLHFKNLDSKFSGSTTKSWRNASDSKFSTPKQTIIRSYKISDPTYQSGILSATNNLDIFKYMIANTASIKKTYTNILLYRWTYDMSDDFEVVIYEVKFQGNAITNAMSVWILPFIIPKEQEQFLILSHNPNYPSLYYTQYFFTGSNSSYPIIKDYIQKSNKSLAYIKYLQGGFEPALKILDNWWELAKKTDNRPIFQAELDLIDYYKKNTWVIYDSQILDENYNAPSDVRIKAGGSLTLFENANLNIRQGREFIVEEGGEVVYSGGRIGFY